MNGALRELLSNGLSSEASTINQPMALTNGFSKHLQIWKGPEHDLIRNYGCLAGNLAHLLRVIKSSDSDHNVARALSIGVIGGEASNQTEWDQARERDAEQLNEFIDQAGEIVEIESYTATLIHLDQVQSAIASLQGFESVPVFVELPKDSDQADSLGLIAETDWMGVSINLASGIDHFQIASAVAECLDLEIPLQVIGQANPWWPTPQIPHATFTMFAAVALAWAESLTAREIEQILGVTTSEHWTITDSSIQFRDWKADIEAIQESRELLFGASIPNLSHTVSELLK